MRRSIALLALALVIGIHLWGALAEIPRAPDVDEVESLQAGVRMARGERPYKDFAEHHPPFTFALLSTFAPESSGRAAEIYLKRARMLFALFGAVALASIAAIVWRASKRLSAVVLSLALLFIHPGLWQRAFIHIRADPPSIALWWLGCACVLLPEVGAKWSAIVRGIGLGLIAHACFWNPKWPLASLLIGIVFLVTVRAEWRLRRASAVISILTAIAAGGSAFALFAMMSDWRLAIGNIFGVTRELVKFADRMQAMHVGLGYGPPIPWGYCPLLFQPQFVLPAAAVTAYAALRIPRAFADRKLVSVLLALLLATLTEIRFLFPYPTAWIQYYLMWATTGAAIYGLALQAVIAIVGFIAPAAVRLTEVATGIVVALAIGIAVNRIPFGESADDPYWVSFRYFNSQLRDDDSVWIGMERLPIGARNANYYWFGFTSFVPVALQYARTDAGSRVLPPIREEDLPPCRLERGLEPHLRFLDSEIRYIRLPAVSQCFARLRARGIIVPAPVPDVYAVRRAGERPPD